ncbi:MAG: Rrf2 family transcriptional regulator, partial [Chloroflexi bacterium]|nr:Rrf2 family transcriptional regulator [Chloroflexota bacterium]MCI0821190.1 Rrf2 family transcriptional regulator [Chloroflexota bacterium]
MRIPMKVDYGVRALVDLAQYATPGRLIRTAEIASREAIPEPYLDQVLTTLNKFGFIRSRRGPQG